MKILPTNVDINRYVSRSRKVYNSIPIIVWIGTPSNVKYLRSLENVLRKLSKNYNFILRIIGPNFKIKELNVEILKWEEEKEIDYLFESDIGIMPLYDTEWEKGKCGFKIIQYMASYLPVVASPSPANNEIIENGNTGFIANNDNEWYKFLEKLIVNVNLRRMMGFNGRRRVEENFTYQIWGEKYVKYIKEAIQGF